MASVIGLSGPQGGGKTTLLNGLKQLGLEVDDFKVSRQVQAELGWDSLENVLTDVHTMREFQTKVLEVKYQRELENVARKDVEFILTERTFADIACYTQLWAWELVNKGDWTFQEAAAFTAPFVDTCVSRQWVYSGNIMLPSMPHVEWQTDPHRAKKEHQSFVTDQLNQFFYMKNPRSTPFFTITEESVAGRVAQTYDWITSL